MAEAFKELFSNKFVEELAQRLTDARPQFAREKFIAQVLDAAWADRELKQRMRHISQTLHAFLPQDYEEALGILMQTANNFSGLAHMVFADFIECHGLDHFTPSVAALGELTKNSSAEFAVRPFIKKYPEKMMQQMQSWAQSKNEHQRRLASEGCRPRLPWAMALPHFKKDPSPILPILEHLKNDPSEYVRKSVANNLNDISKDNPEIVIKIARKWLGENKETDWIIKHGCRTLLRDGNTEVLLLFGFQEPANISVNNLTVTRKVQMGDSIIFSFGLNAKDGTLGKIRLEYVIDFMKANGKQAPKIFKISEGDFAVSQRMIKKSHSFRQITTRKYYPGKHGLRIIVNGIEKASTSFDLK